MLLIISLFVDKCFSIISAILSYILVCPSKRFPYQMILSLLAIRLCLKRDKQFISNHELEKLLRKVYSLTNSVKTSADYVCLKCVLNNLTHSVFSRNGNRQTLTKFSMLKLSNKNYFCSNMIVDEVE